MKEARTKYQALARLSSILTLVVLAFLMAGLVILVRLLNVGLAVKISLTISVGLLIWWGAVALMGWIGTEPCRVSWHRELITSGHRKELVEVGEWFCCRCEARAIQNPDYPTPSALPIGCASINGHGGQERVMACPACKHVRCCDD